MEQILSSIWPKKPQLSKHNSLQTISLDKSSILVHIDTTTFANPVKKQNTNIKYEFPMKMLNLKFKFEFIDEPTKTTYNRRRTCFVNKTTNGTAKRRKRCVMGCRHYKGLHRCPLDEISREVWRKKLKKDDLKKTHRVCSRHFKKQFGIKMQRLPGWAVPDTPETSDSEENYIENNFSPLLDVKLKNAVLKNEKKSLTLEDILACK